MNYKKRNFLILSPSEWGDSAVSNMQISAELSKKHNVTYIETPGRRMPKLNELSRAIKKLVKIFFSKTQFKINGLDKVNVKIFSPFAIPSSKFFIIRKINKLLLVLQIKKYLEKVDTNNLTIWCYSPLWLDVIKTLKYSNLIFHCVDGLHTYNKGNYFADQYDAIAKKSDIIITPGIILYEELKKINTNTYRISHGVTEELLSIIDKKEKIIPSEILKIKNDIVIYSGTLANWVDFKIIEYIAKELEDITFLIIGYVHALTAKKDINKIIALKNVILTGFKNYHELPHYYKHCKVAIVPYQINEHIIYSSPTKFFDYFSAGLPVVTTKFPSAETFGDLVYIANDKESFLSSLKKAIKEDDMNLVQRRKDITRNSTWAIQVTKMIKLIEDFEKNGD